jgi:hypothetical protein
MTPPVRRFNSVRKQKIQALIQVLDIRRSNRMNKSDAIEMLQGVATLHQPVSFLVVYKYTVCSNGVQCISLLSFFYPSRGQSVILPAQSSYSQNRSNKLVCHVKALSFFSVCDFSSLYARGLADTQEEVLVTRKENVRDCRQK